MFILLKSTFYWKYFYWKVLFIEKYVLLKVFFIEITYNWNYFLLKITFYEKKVLFIAIVEPCHYIVSAI